SARAVALSFVYPSDDAHLHRELKRLGHLMPASTAIVAGGRAVEGYATCLDAIGARRVTSLAEFRDELESLRS
ncbi:MAG: transcriptional regulator, partial [Candidatus Hydrogenedentes bacterium]|nr:transcriptional regulator [Candidatus Hydrogenedentota bacterium]